MLFLRLINQEHKNYYSHLNQIKIIVHEADSNIRDILKYVLDEAGYDAIVLADCDELLGLIDEFKPRVLLLDYIVSGIQCIKTCHEVKARFPHLPVIALSCNPKIGLVYYQEGFDDYIAKPFDLDHFYDVLRTHTGVSKNTPYSMESQGF